MASAFDAYFYETNVSALVYVCFKAKIFRLSLLLQRMSELEGKKDEKIRLGKSVRGVVWAYRKRK